MFSRVQFWLLLAALNGAIWLFAFRSRTIATARLAEQVAAEGKSPSLKEKHAPPILVRTNAFQWGQLESEDYRTYINRLRSIDCPEETIRDIIIADLEKLMMPDLQATEGKREPPKYWEPKTRERTVDTLAKAGQKQDIDFKKREIVRELLGIDLASERSRAKGERDSYAERLGFLDPEKQMRVRMAIEKANREETLLREESWLENDELTPDDKKQLREIQQRKTGEIEQLLTPDELERYNLWFSSSAYRVRDAFLVLDPNEQDFLALYRFQKEFDDRWDGVDPNILTPEEKWQYQQAQTKLNDQIHEHLGQERYEKFLQTREPDFQQMQDTIAQFALKPEVAGEVYSFKKVLVEERNHVNATASIDPGQKQEILRALSEETEKAVVETMGPKPYRYYVRNGAGKWIFQ
jgi:hypothetical protein